MTIRFRSSFKGKIMHSRNDTLMPHWEPRTFSLIWTSDSPKIQWWICIIYIGSWSSSYVIQILWYKSIVIVTKFAHQSKSSRNWYFMLDGCKARISGLSSSCVDIFLPNLKKRWESDEKESGRVYCISPEGQTMIYVLYFAPHLAL